MHTPTSSERGSFAPPTEHTTRPTLHGSFGMSASTHWLATASAQSVLERGGNAVDAAVAAGFVLQVVEPHLNGPGGDLVAMIASGQSVQVVCGQGVAPRRATADLMTAAGLTDVPGAGALAAAVPGATEAWLWMLEHRGTWELGDVLEYAVHYAEHGFVCSAQLAGVLATMADHFAAHWPTSAETWLPHGVPPREGALVINPRWATVLRRLASAPGTTRGGRIASARGVWRGPVARAIEKFVSTPHRHSSGTDHAGVITAQDMRDVTTGIEDPLTVSFHGVEVAKAGFWSQGPVLLQALGILDHVPTDRLDPSTTAGAHTVVEAVKLAMADRDAYYGDSADAARLQALLSPDYCRDRATQILDHASSELRPGRLDGVDPFRPPLRRTGESAVDTSVGEPTVRPDGRTRGDTCHVDVVDRWGNLVSATPSGGWLQSSPAVADLGFSLGTRLQMTWLDQSSPSALAPGRRPRTTLTPTVVMRDGVAVSALGTPGGDQQDQWQLLYLLRTVVGRYTSQQAIDAPAFHTTSLVSSFWPREFTPAGVVAEDRLGADVRAGLTDRGHDVTVVGGWSLGRLSVVSRDPDSGALSAAANPRGSLGYAAGR